MNDFYSQSNQRQQNFSNNNQKSNDANSQKERKVYTLEDNVAGIKFELKALNNTIKDWLDHVQRFN